MDWIDVAQNRDTWMALENENKPTDSIKCEEFLGLDENLLASQEGICCIELVILFTFSI